MSVMHETISNQVNLKTTDFFCYVGNERSNDVIPWICNSVSGIVVAELNNNLRHSLQKEFLDVKFVDSIDGLDEGAYDKIVCEYDRYLFGNEPLVVINRLISCCDHKGMILIKNLPDCEMVATWLENKYFFKYWTFGTNLLFEVKKYV